MYDIKKQLEWVNTLKPGDIVVYTYRKKKHCPVVFHKATKWGQAVISFSYTQHFERIYYPKQNSVNLSRLRPVPKQLTLLFE